jgi:hypothetical protein
MKTKKQIAAVFKELTDRREAQITHYMTAFNMERFQAAIEVDSSAPTTTNWEQLVLLGIDPNTAPLYDIIHGLSLWGVFLLSTNHLPDEVLRAHIVSKVLRDPITMIPPNDDMSEFIDMSCSRTATDTDVADRDAHLPRPKNGIADHV